MPRVGSVVRVKRSDCLRHAAPFIYAAQHAIFYAAVAVTALPLYHHAV